MPLGDVADVEAVTGPLVVSRNKQSRRITVEFNVRGRDLVSVVDDARAAVAARRHAADGLPDRVGRQFENYLSAKARLLLVVPLALLAILFLLWLAFDRGKPALLIFLNIPFAIVGGVVALAAARDAVLHLGGRRLHRAVRRGGAERPRAGVVRATARSAGRSPHEAIAERRDRGCGRC